MEEDRALELPLGPHGSQPLAAPATGGDDGRDGHAPWPAKLAAWAVHGFTASGAVVGVLALLAISQDAPRAAALWMLVALAIDSVDGSLARRAAVSERAPRIDGRRLDDIVDFLNYAVVPAVFLVELGLLTPLWAAVALLASCYGFAQQEAKTEDHFFLGFPSYWNVVAIYAWLLGVEPATVRVVVAILAALVFVPFRYLYPSRMPVLRRSTNLVALAWGAAIVACVIAPAWGRRTHLAPISLAFPIYYFALSFWLGRWWEIGRGRRSGAASAGAGTEGAAEGDRTSAPGRGGGPAAGP